LLATIGLATLALGFAPAPLPREKKDNKAPKKSASLDGTWALVSLGRGGAAKPPPRNINLKVRIGNGRWAFVRREPQAIEYEVVIDANANPKTIDLRRPGAPMPTIRGIWEVEGDTLRMAYFPAKGAEGRPASFDMAQPRLIVMTLRKEP
jgi:uncharacterized protein (TIGR03067 family)